MTLPIQKSAISFFILFFLCNTCMASSGGSLGESMLIGFLTIPLLIFFYFLVVFIHSKIAPNDYKNSMPTQDDVSTQVFEQKDPLETLKSLFDSGVLSETEYIEKLNNYNERFKIEEKQIEDKKQQQQFQKLFDERTIPLIKLIDDAKMQGVITQIEFEKKKEEIISKNSEEIKYILSQKPRFSDISDNIELVNKYEGRVKIFLDRLQPEQLLIYAYGDFQNITREKWEKMLKSEDAKNYKLIIEYKIPKENNP